MEMKLKAVIFDLDGTLLDSLEDIADAIDQMLLGRGYPPCGDPEIFRQMIGDGMDNLVARALPEQARTPEIISAGVAEYRAHYERLWRNKTCLYEGIEPMLDALRARGLKLGVISNKAHRFVLPNAQDSRAHLDANLLHDHAVKGWLSRFLDRWLHVPA